jgi:hypothetical protein
MGKQRVKPVAAEVGGPITLADLGTNRVPRITTPQDPGLWVNLYGGARHSAAPAALGAAVVPQAVAEFPSVPPTLSYEGKA